MASPLGRATTIGKYEIVELIGEGGYGTVHHGFDPHIRRQVAIKTCTSADREMKERFYREAQIAGNLDHPNIVRIFDLGLEDGTPFLVQEFLSGEDLERKIARGAFIPFPEKLLYLIQVARGLEYAHSRGVIHRDVKPGNIRVLDDGTAKIMDFGIAKLTQTASPLTQVGMTVGTAAYLAPEQIRGEPADERTDVFSFGVVAYELITGVRPFGGETISATFFQILNRDPQPVPALCRDCPQRLAELIDRCLDKDPHRRCPDFATVLAALEGVRDQRRPASRPADSPTVTRPIRTAPAPRPAADATTLRLPTEPEIDPPLERTPAPISAAYRAHGPGRRATVWLALLAVVALAAGAWTLAGKPLPAALDPASGPVATAAPGLVPWSDPAAPAGRLAVPDPQPAAAAADAAPSPLGPDEAGSAPEPPVPAAPEPSPGAPGAGDDPAAPAAPSEEPAPPTSAPPVPATLRLTAAWSPRITVSIDGGPPLGLGRPRSFELEPGAHTLAFALVTPRYRAMERVRVVLEPGETRTVPMPIAPPGLLTVQAALGSPQGSVRIAGRETRPTPLRAEALTAGTYRIALYRAADPYAPAFETTVEVVSAQHTLVTFDLTGRRELLIRRRAVER